MDKLTAIKIKYDNGTYSDEIPVSVLSENVEWDSTHTLVDILGSVDVNVTGTIQDQISRLFNEKVNAIQLQNYVASQLNEDVSSWLNTNVNPVGSAVVVDSSLTISGAAADAKIVGDNINVILALSDGMYISNTGTSKGYFHGQKVVADDAYSHVHLVKPFLQKSVEINATKVSYNTIYVIKNNTVTGYGGQVGKYSVDISDADEVYVNYFGESYYENVKYTLGIATQKDVDTLQKNVDSIEEAIFAKKPYQSGFITFTVPSRVTKSNNSVSASSASEGSDDSVDVNCIIKLPESYTPNGDPTKLIMICHGAGKSAISWSQNAHYIALTNAFVNAGYAIFDCNGYKEDELGYSFWGDSRGVDVWRKAYQYVINNYNVEHQFCLYGFSMGGLTALNLAFSNFPNIKCIALGSPVVSLEACYNDSTVKDTIKILYGMGDTYDKSLAYGCDPYSHILTLNDKKYIFSNLPPLKIWFGGTETGTGTDTGTDLTVSGCVNKNLGKAIVTAINNAGGMAEYREVQNAGHEICYGENTTVNSDYVLYFNRYCL